MLPFIAGAILGVGAVVAVNNNKKIKEKVVSGANSVKQTAIKAKEKVQEKVDCITKKDDKDKEKIEVITDDN